MRLFEPAQGLLAVTGYNGRGVTTGTVVGKAFADYLLSGERATLPLPFSDMKPVPAARLRSCAYEMGFSLSRRSMLARGSLGSTESRCVFSKIMIVCCKHT